MEFLLSRNCIKVYKPRTSHQTNTRHADVALQVNYARVDRERTVRHLKHHDWLCDTIHVTNVSTLTMPLRKDNRFVPLLFCVGTFP